ncbi:probable LRR receptor-like serine/threonine-protein kinase At3g47570 [Gossypium hirsutum]|uniref:Probable LRR receptor-like serine/threonine-protein kinase At3g47570 n=1 Tax=Gossypium hirsutum TaxID=3635 RepID=A0ABM3AT08_GOSHI|nr:probable LRR receptor-like serine/threonine-protein kinase At3g47570 [Gossypium hirsutum]
MEVASSFFIVCFQVIILSLFSLAYTAPISGGNDTDLQALLRFKANIIGDQLGVMDSWNSSVHFCQWHGVTCSRKRRRVTKLELQLLKLSGSLSPYIGNLSFLKELNLEGNIFYNQIPQKICRLRRLETLELSNNSITGEIPSNLSACYKLTLVGMRGNQLTGEIPASLGLLSNLKVLNFAINRLRGSIPPSLGNLSCLEKLSLRTNSLSGVIPEGIGQLTNLSVFSVEENAISGTIPFTMFNLSNMRSFDIGGNNIQGTLPSDLAITMPYIEFFSAWENQISRKILISISNASNLNILQLNENRLIGNVPSLEKLDKLANLLLGTNHLGNGREGDLNFLCSLVNNTKIETIDIQTNNFGGELPECISNFSSTLLFLVIENNKILGKIPDGIGNLINLQVLRVSQNQLSSPIPPNIGRIQKLKRFDARYNFLTGTIPHSIRNLTGLTFLALGVNNFQGNIPSSLGHCQNLLTLGLSYNNLSGSIPPQVLALSSLSILLNLSSNYLTGELPVEVEKLKNLGDLDVSKNKLSGLLPNSLGSCVRLEKLFLGGNLFEGPILSSMSSLRGLAALDVSDNNLSGEIPEFLASFGALKYLNLSFNDFGGIIPSGGVFKNSSATFVEGNDKLCGGITELHLSRCNSEKSSNTSLRLKLVIVSVILGVTLIFLFLLIMLFRKKKEHQPTTTCAENSLLRLSYQSILRATNGFSTQNLVGLGSFGSVYRGILEETGEVIAVKVLNLLNHGASRSFLAECEVLKNIRHRNLVKVLTAILGADYQGNDFKALVYEFMVNGSLEDWLHPPAGTNEPETIRNLNLFHRLNVAIYVAHALEYLHHRSQILIIHCDLKPSNILLDAKMVAYISVLEPTHYRLNYSASQSSSLGLRGTIGYAPPEYGMGSELSTKGDVYSYGILLLEMFTGKRPMDEKFKEGLSLHNFVKSALPDRVIEILDPILFEERVQQETLKGKCLRNEIHLQCLNLIYEIGLICSAESPSARMDMSDVVTKLCSIRDKLYPT